MNFIPTDEEAAAEDELSAIMTASEVDEAFGLADGTCRQTCNRGAIRARKSGGTWLVRRADAEKHWGDKATVIAVPVFVNRSDRYGDAVAVTIEDYRELNPEGEFEIRADGIYEDTRHGQERIAEIQKS